MVQHLTLATIDQMIQEFKKLTQDGRHPNRLYLAGGRLSGVRDELHERLDVGYRMLQAADGQSSKPMEDLWLELLQRYETICDLLEDHPVRLVDAAKSMYNAEELRE